MKRFEVNGNGLPEFRGEWPEGSLWVGITENEDDLRVMTFTDEQGKEVLKGPSLQPATIREGTTAGLALTTFSMILAISEWSCHRRLLRFCIPKAGNCPPTQTCRRRNISATGTMVGGD